MKGSQDRSGKGHGGVAGGKRGPSNRVVLFALAISAASLLLSFYEEWQRRIEKAVALELAERERQSEAFILGRRASVYESVCLFTQSLASHAGMAPESLRTRASAEKEWIATLAGNDMAIAAGPLRVNLSAQEEPWMLERRIAEQLHDTYSPRVRAAYTLGRLLGHYDDRSYIVVDRTARSVEFQSCPELANRASRGQWTKLVDSLVAFVGIRVLPAWSDTGSAWGWCAEGRLALDDVGHSFEQSDRTKSTPEDEPKSDSFGFEALVGWHGRDLGP